MAVQIGKCDKILNIDEEASRFILSHRSPRIISHRRKSEKADKILTDHTQEASKLLEKRKRSKIIENGS